MSDFLLELRSEEIPARMQAGARADLERLFRAEMAAAGVSPGAVSVWSTPRRLALIACDLPLATEAVSEEAKGPPEGAPDQAIDGFCRKNGVTRDQLELRDVKGRNTYFAVIEKPGRAVADVLADAIPAIVRAFPWPKSMRWGAASLSTESLRWVRPLSGVVALLDSDVVECEVGGVASGRLTRGHRFHSNGDIAIAGVADYAATLREAHVIVDHAERQNLIREQAAKVAADAGLTLVADEGLVIENAGLTEWPQPLLGRFDEAFLDVPPEVIQLSARTNQKYFVCEDSAGKLANAFVCTANIASSDGGAAIVDGNRKVLAARLSDARFFWELDQKTRLEDHAKKLERITFHEKLGTVADKVERVAKLARWLVEEGIVTPSLSSREGGDRGQPGAPSPEVPAFAGTREELADQAEQAARLCKADLVTEMVGEFPELQGLMGGYYARAEGLPDAVADAIRDHYKPVGQGDDVPTAPVTVAVSLADKLDTLASFFEIEEFPTGSKDPFALRRATIGLLNLVRENGLTLHFGMAIEAGWLGYLPTTQLSNEDTSRMRVMGTVTHFILDRLEVLLKDAGIRYDYVAASRRWENAEDGRVDRVEARALSLQSFMDTEDGTNLLAGYKRAANILRKEGWEDTAERIARTGDEDPMENVDDPQMRAIYAQRGANGGLSYTPEAAEKALIDALDAAEPQAAAAIEAEDFAAAMAALASLRAPIDRFFEEVTVNADEEIKRTTRLGLLARFRAAVHNVADFSRIEG